MSRHRLFRCFPLLRQVWRIASECALRKMSWRPTGVRFQGSFNFFCFVLSRSWLKEQVRSRGHDSLRVNSVGAGKFPSFPRKRLRERRTELRPQRKRKVPFTFVGTRIESNICARSNQRVRSTRAATTIRRPYDSANSRCARVPCYRERDATGGHRRRK